MLDTPPRPPAPVYPDGEGYRQHQIAEWTAWGLAAVFFLGGCGQAIMAVITPGDRLEYVGFSFTTWAAAAALWVVRKLMRRARDISDLRP